MKKALFVSMAAGLLMLGMPAKSEAVLAGSFRVCQGATCTLDIAIANFGSISGITVGDYEVAAQGSWSQSTAFSNSASNALSITRVTTNSAAALDVWFTVTGYTLPSGPQFVMSTSGTAKKTGTSSDLVTASAWYSSTNSTGFPTGVLGGSGGCTPAPSATILETSCSGSTPNTPIGPGSALYSIISRTTFNIGLTDFSDFSSTASATITAVPEPGSMVLLGTGLLGLAATIRRRMKK